MSLIPRFLLQAGGGYKLEDLLVSTDETPIDYTDNADLRVVAKLKLFSDWTASRVGAGLNPYDIPGDENRLEFLISKAVGPVLGFLLVYDLEIVGAKNKRVEVLASVFLATLDDELRDDVVKGLKNLRAKPVDRGRPDFDVEFREKLV